MGHRHLRQRRRGRARHRRLCRRQRPCEDAAPPLHRRSVDYALMTTFGNEAPNALEHSWTRHPFTAATFDTAEKSSARATPSHANLPITKAVPKNLGRDG